MDTKAGLKGLSLFLLIAGFAVVCLSYTRLLANHRLLGTSLVSLGVFVNWLSTQFKAKETKHRNPSV